jgi:hypothetical protein
MSGVSAAAAGAGASASVARAAARAAAREAARMVWGVGVWRDGWRAEGYGQGGRGERGARGCMPGRARRPLPPAAASNARRARADALATGGRSRGALWAPRRGQVRAMRRARAPARFLPPRPPPPAYPELARFSRTLVDARRR